MRPDEAFISREIETAFDWSPSKLRVTARELPIAEHGKAGVPRKFAPGEVILLAMAELLMRRGFAREGATAAVSEMAPELPLLTKDEGRESWLIVWSAETAESGIGHELVHSRSEGLEVVFAHDNATILTIRPLAEKAMRMILTARDAALEGGE